MNPSVQPILATLRHGFVASCQPVDDGPMDHPTIVSAMAQASVIGGAAGLRIEGVENLKAVRPNVSVPIIGIVKHDLVDFAVRITPFLEDVRALKEAGADIIAIDATRRVRPVSVAELVKEIHQVGCLAMADCSTLEEGLYCQSIGVEIIGSTLSGYISGITPNEPDFELVKQLKAQGCTVMAEGRYNSPQLARQAIELGAHCVTVGSAITRVEHICGWFKNEVNKAAMEPIKAMV
ncbi:MAG: N-acetylmannosamine-6-phosphate 2-epimerase [Aliivibrio sp.]|uniref:N-acetylmannosamine-6-phosphate 2-epimerase n=1 Tax=Aliivibrio sp. TaxID=1872443 RepID=UPI001A59CC5F|nr:N-acetylmannosamine-6-phosphate 2-epimerase [Aliivibrio sp.]